MLAHDLAHMIRVAWDHHGSIASATSATVAGATALILHDSFFETWLGVPMPVLLASFAGAACALSFLPRMGVTKSLVALVVSTVAAAYLVPIASWSLNVPDKLAIGFAFLLALFGQTLIGSAFVTVPHVASKLVEALAERIRGSRRP